MSMIPDLRAALAHVLGIHVDDLADPPPWDETLEQRISHVAETYDEETGRGQALLPRKDQP